MPELGKYEKLPRPESIKAIIDYSLRNTCVKNVEQTDSQIIEVKRKEKEDLIVYLTNIYIVSETDVQEILLSFPDIDCIVTVSAWNSYTEHAKIVSISKSVGLFKFKEFLGALYYDGSKFINYEPPKRDEEDGKRKIARGC